MSTIQHLLCEHANGFELFEMKAFESISSLSYADYLSLTQVVNHVSSLPFQNVADASDQIKILETGMLSENLTNFLEMNNVKILHCDKSLKQALKNIGIEQRTSMNIYRGVKLNLKKFLKNSTETQFVLGLSHTLAKEHIKYNLEREDNVVISTGYEIETLERELEGLKEKRDKLVHWFQNSTPNCSSNDKENDSVVKNEMIDHEKLINGYNIQINQKEKLIDDLKLYLADKMKKLAPNLRQILGDRLCFKMIHKAGGLVNLSLYPSSTLQLLGAEKSLFRSLRMRKNTPKHGLIYQLDYVKDNIGRMSRFIATKCSLAARIDCYSPDRTDEYGKELKKLIEKKMRSLKKTEKTSDLLERVHKRIQATKDKI